MQAIAQVSAAELKGTEVFVGVAADKLSKIARLCELKTYEAGEYCAVRGGTADHLLIVNGGRVASEMQVEGGQHTYTMTIANLTKGKVGAWSAVVPPHVLTSSLKCVERAQIISIAASDLQRVFEEDPDVECAVMKNLAFVIGSRLRDNQVQLQRLVAEIIRQGTAEAPGK